MAAANGKPILISGGGIGGLITAYALAIGFTFLAWRLLEQFLVPSAARALLMSASGLLAYGLVREAMLGGLWRWMLHVSLGTTRPQPVELR